MLKSTSRPVKTAVRLYILDHINPDGYGIESFATPADAVLWCYKTFKSEMAAQIRLWGEREAFKSWLCGLASALTLPFLYSAPPAHDLVQEWLQQTDGEADLYDEMEAEQYAIRLINREFFAMVQAAQRTRRVI